MNFAWNYKPALLAICLMLVSCQKDAPEPEIDINATLLSTGWQMEKYILHYFDGSPDAETDSLVLTMVRSDSLEDSRAVYTHRWIVFDQVAALTAFNYNLYYREKGDSAWRATRFQIPGEAGTLWGKRADSLAYLNHESERPILIDVIDEDMFILRDAYVIETIESYNFGEGNITYTFGDFPSKNLASIDAVYRSASASEGPNWFPSWPYWPLE